MDKIWIVYNRGSYKRKYKIYKSEAEMYRNVSENSSESILEYELKSSTVASEYFKSKERDTQLRNILGELSDNEINAIELIGLFEKLAKEDRYKNRILSAMKKVSGDKKSFSNLLVKHKREMFEVSDSVEWIHSLLKCHNFQEYFVYKVWNRETRKNDIIDKRSEEFKENFKLAKQQLKKKKK